jgi:hypothetical protein
MIASSILGFLIGVLYFEDMLIGISWGIFFALVFRIVIESSSSFVFREWGLFLYCINYLIAPSLTYQLEESQVLYPMKIESSLYFALAVPGFLCLMLGMFLIPTHLFRISLEELKQSIQKNEAYLSKVFWVCIALNLGQDLFPGELGFLVYLFSSMRFVAAFALITLHSRHWPKVALVLAFELGKGLLQGMYHDAIMWLIFFVLYYLFALKPGFRIKSIGFVSLAAIVLFVQAVKFAYRSEIASGEVASMDLVQQVASENSDSDVLLGDENLLSTLNRGNQAWIFASTVDRMDQGQDFQGMANVNLYLEAALLPRILAPNKLRSGNKEIFNRFSGHSINENTSMGLGIFADGYIAYGDWGVYGFCLALGLLFSMTFKIVERWTKSSAFYLLMILPLLNYAVRPDCELQTTINHLSKGLMLFGFIFYTTRFRFRMRNQSEPMDLHLRLFGKK